MNSSQKILAVVGFVVVVGAIAGVVLFANRGEDSQPNTASTNSSTSSPENNTGNESEASTSVSQFDDFLAPANVRGTVDMQDQQEVAVEIGDMYYDATVLTVSQDTTVTWTNEGNMGHNVVTDESSPDGGELSSELLGNGETYSYTFDEPGTYYYFCEPHPTSMRGVVIVK